MSTPQPCPSVRLAIFLSGKGSNAENIIQYYLHHDEICVAALYTDKESSGAFALGEQYGLPILLFSRTDLQNANSVLSADLKEKEITHIILAGFLRLVPAWLIARYPEKILNIHPALLPKYGGKGMYGSKVHETVWENREKETGITIHLVNEHYDEGQIIAQYKCAITPIDSPVDIEGRVRALELAHYPRVIEKYIKGREPAG